MLLLTSFFFNAPATPEIYTLSLHDALPIFRDKHSRSYQALLGDVGERMALILKLGAKAEEAPKCLACHALNPAPEQRGRAFEISEGVSCENCHGPASAWLGPHTTRAWPHEKSVAAGMQDRKSVV